MANIEFTSLEKEQLIDKIQHYFLKELDQELGQFDADFLLDFFSKEMGSFFYNRGLYDAQRMLEKKVEEISDAIYQLEQVTN
jgi:uncharacterized protein (DUF2164 family)